MTVLFLLTLSISRGQSEEIRLASADLNHYAPSLDSLVASTLEDIRASKTDAALANVDRIIAMRPDFKLAYLIKGDLLQAKAGALAKFGAAAGASEQAKLDGLKDEAKVRLMRYLDQPDPGKLPKQILQLAPSQRYALLADADRARLYVFENANGEPRLIRDYYVSVGRNGVNKRSEGDLKTPSGVYNITTELPRSKLTAFYGAGAFPLDYPNEWDTLQGNSGHGIWLHGVPPDTYSRPPKASEGCLVLANPDYQEIRRYIVPERTPIVIADRTEWLDRADWLAARKDILMALDAWKADWQHLDAEHYLNRYSRDFLDRAGRGWAESKRRNIVQKNWIRIGLADVSLFLYPSDNLAVLNFTQVYDSDKLSDVTRKRFYLKREDNHWRIALERSLQDDTSVARND
ncbi:L,D-transpeptidase family protein [Parasulfuritortus cantonensis]|uniref:L,D-transpeptidase family protein n=1 Tax=Parasulfuritortus cantonensis TaxID=2528202 RepID=UPI0014043267|nr:L,D-transpeptidase family protein [Parasulfuritortus cantonensis]